MSFLWFPIAPGAKKPPLVEFTAEATDDPEQLAAWAEQWPDANWGVLAHGLFILDVDPGKGGFDSLAELPPLPETFTVSTPSGGRHYYFAWPDGGTLNRVDMRPGLDVRAGHGYVVGPGSRVNGRDYEIVRSVPLAPVPPGLLALARERGGNAPRLEAEDISPEDAAEQAREWLAHRAPAIEGQGGDHWTFKTIAWLRDIGVPETWAASVLETWNARCDPPWDPDELETKIRNAYRYAENAPGSRAVVFHSQDPPPALGGLIRPEAIDWGDIRTSPYLVKKWLDRGSQALLWGDWGSGKTFITLHLALALAGGTEWFGYRTQPTGVLYAGYEGHRGLRKRLYAAHQEYGGAHPERVRAVPMDAPLLGDGRQMLTHALKAYLDEHGHYPGLIVVDTLRDALGGSESDPERTAPFLDFTRRLSTKTGAAVLVVHHPGHEQKDRSRGDYGLEAAMDTVIQVDGLRGTIGTVKHREEATQTVFYRLRVVELGEDQDGDPVTTCVVDAVDRNPLDPTLTDTQRAVYDELCALYGAEPFSKTDAMRRLSAAPRAVRAEVWQVLKQKGYVMQDGRHWYTASPAEPFAHTPGDGTL